MTRPTEPRALFLDLDGTLADSLGVMKAVYRRFMEGEGLTPSDVEFDRLNGPPIAECVRIIKDTHRLAAPHAELIARYQTLVDEVYATVPPSAGARELLAAAKARGWTVGVVTSNGEARTRAWLGRARLDDLIDIVVDGDSIQRGKPAPDPYLAALARARCKADAALAVEDSPQGAKAACAAGIPTLALVRNSSSIADWPEGVAFVHSLADVRRRIEAEG
jgi:HAD superfamily hydrolase (TIGR01509 family)